jgi:hypothetical protein
MPKATATEVEQRINQVFMLLIQGEPNRKIVQYCSENWGICERQSAEYIARAKRLISEVLADQRVENLSLAIAQRNNLYRLAYKQGKWFTCLQILDSRDRILGLFDDLDTHIAIVEAAGYIVRDPRLEADDGDPAGDLFAAVEAV